MGDSRYGLSMCRSLHLYSMCETKSQWADQSMLVSNTSNRWISEIESIGDALSLLAML